MSDSSGLFGGVLSGAYPFPPGAADPAAPNKTWLPEETRQLIESLEALDKTLEGFRDQLKAMHVALTVKGILPRGAMNVTAAVAMLPEVENIISGLAQERARKMLTDLLKDASDGQVRREAEEKARANMSEMGRRLRAHLAQQ